MGDPLILPPAPPKADAPAQVATPITPAAATDPAAATLPPAPPPPPPPARAGGKVTVLAKDGTTKPAEGAVVYLERVDPALWKDRKRPPGGAPKITMKEKRFDPRVLPVLVGRPVAFPNLDPIFHNVFSLTGNNKFDLGLYKDGKSQDHAFAEPGVVRMFCNIHPSMSAYVLVMQNPWWASVAADGTYRLGDIPPGTWTLKVWHERGGESSREITVAAGQRLQADFELDGRKFKVVPHKNKLGKDYAQEGY